jgi:hypothetical protein
LGVPYKRPVAGSKVVQLGLLETEKSNAPPFVSLALGWKLNGWPTTAIPGNMPPMDGGVVSAGDVAVGGPPAGIVSDAAFFGADPVVITLTVENAVEHRPIAIALAMHQRLSVVQCSGTRVMSSHPLEVPENCCRSCNCCASLAAEVPSTSATRKTRTQLYAPIFPQQLGKTL